MPWSKRESGPPLKVKSVVPMKRGLSLWMIRVPGITSFPVRSPHQRATRGSSLSPALVAALPWNWSFLGMRFSLSRRSSSSVFQGFRPRRTAISDPPIPMRRLVNQSSRSSGVKWSLLYHSLLGFSHLEFRFTWFFVKTANEVNEAGGAHVSVLNDDLEISIRREVLPV